MHQFNILSNGVTPLVLCVQLFQIFIRKLVYINKIAHRNVIFLTLQVTLHVLETLDYFSFQ